MALLTITNVILAAATYVVCLVVNQVVYYRFFHPLSKFPGTFWGSVTRLWITWHNVQADECETFRALHKEHGTSFYPTSII